MTTPRLKCIAIDDEPLALKLIRQYVDNTPSLQLLHVFDDAVSGAEYLRNNPVDLLFIDINMPDISGIDLVRSLQHKPFVIFTTAYKKFAYEGFELEVVDYLLKPIAYDRFAKAVDKALAAKQQETIPRQEDEYIFVRSAYQLVKVGVDNIIYIEGLEDYIRIHLADGKPVMTLVTLKSILEKLPAGKFMRIHRSYIIPLEKIKSILNRKLLLQTGIELPISDTYIDPLNEWVNKAR